MKLLAISAVVALGLYFLARKWRISRCEYVAHILDTWPQPGNGHAPGDGAIKGQIIYELQVGLTVSWIAQILGTVIAVALINYYFLS